MNVIEYLQGPGGHISYIGGKKNLRNCSLKVFALNREYGMANHLRHAFLVSNQKRMINYMEMNQHSEIKGINHYKMGKRTDDWCSA